MTRINNGADLNKYYTTWAEPETKANIDKKNKTRLIIRKDKETGKEYLDTKKLTLPERIGALFGGRASFSRVVEFCNQKNMHSEGLAKLVEHYNKGHLDKKIRYLYLPGGAKIETSLTSALEPKKVPTTDKEVQQQVIDKIIDDRTIDTSIAQVYASGNDDALVQILEKLPEGKKQQILDNACTEGEVRMIVLLHKSGMSNFDDTYDMYTPLMRAAEAGHAEVVERLLYSFKANPTIGNSVLGNPLLLAARNGHGQVAFQIAVRLSNDFTPERLIKLLEDPNISIGVKEAIIPAGEHKVNKDGKNALMLAIDDGKLDMANLLATHTYTNTKDSNGDNALLHACKQPATDGRNTLISALLQRAPSEILHKNNNGRDALSYANDDPSLRAELQKFATTSSAPEAQEILEKLAEDAKKAEESAQRVEEASQAARQAEISKNLDTIKTEARKQKLEDVRSLPALTQDQDTPLLEAYRAIGKTALKDTDPNVRGFILLDLTRTVAGTTPEDRTTLISKNLTTARLPLMWLNAQLDKLPPTGASTKDKVAKLDFETKGKTLMAAYASVIEAGTYAKLLKDYPAFKPL